MANDPGLTDTCIFLDDGNPAWLSPDISLTGPLSGSDKADPNPNNNQVGIKVRRRANCQLSPEIGVILVDVYVCNPAIAVTPANSTRITNAPSRPSVSVNPTSVPQGGVVTAPFNWQIPASPGSNESPGHKCLIARVYPDDNTPSPTTFFIDDPHIVQRNICIVPCDTRMGNGVPGVRAAARQEGGCSFGVQTANVNETQAEEVTLVAVADLTPSKQVLDVVTQALNNTPGIEFKRFAPRPPQRFFMQLPDFPNAIVRDESRPKGCLTALLRLFGKRADPRYEARFTLARQQVTRLTFAPDLTASQPGDAHVFHLSQVGPGRVTQGGLTLVFVVV